MNQPSTVQQVKQLFLSETNYTRVDTFLQKIREKEQIYYQPICQAIQSTIVLKDPVQCFLAAKMAKGAIDLKNLDFMTVFQNTCLQDYEELAKTVQNQKLADAVNRHFVSSNVNRDSKEDFGKSFFHLLLECIEKWAKQYPKQNDEITPTKFHNTYQKLVQLGIQFPPEFYFKKSQLDVLQDLQQQLIQMEKQHQKELNLRDLQHESEIENLQEQIKFFQNSKTILEQKVSEYKSREISVKKGQLDIQQAQLLLEQKEEQLKIYQKREEQFKNFYAEKQVLENKIQQLTYQNQQLLINNQSLSDKITQQINEKEINANYNLQNQLKELQLNNASLKKQLDIYKQDVEKKNIMQLEQKQEIMDLKLKLTVLEKNGSANEDSKQIQNKINQLEQKIIDDKQKIKSLKEQNKKESSIQQEYALKNQQLEVIVKDLNQRILQLEQKCKEQQEQLKQNSPNKVNQQSAGQLQQRLVKNQNFFPQEQQQKQQQVQEQIGNTDFNQNAWVKNLDSTIYPYQTAEQYYSSIKKQPSCGQLISYENLIINWKYLKIQNKQQFQEFHVNKTKIIYINESLFKVAIFKQTNKVGSEYQINYGIQINNEDEILNIKAQILNLEKISNYFILSKKDNLQFSLQKQQQVLIEYCINNKCSNLTESPILQLCYHQMTEQIFLPIPLFSFIEFNQIAKQTFKHYWKQIFIMRSNEFRYNPLILPKYDSFLQISKSFTVLNENKLNRYLKGKDELKIVAQFKFLSLQFEGYIKFELIPLHQMIIYAGYDKQKYKKFDSLIENVIFAYQSILQQY